MTSLLILRAQLLQTHTPRHMRGAAACLHRAPDPIGTKGRLAVQGAGSVSAPSLQDCAKLWMSGKRARERAREGREGRGGRDVARSCTFTSRASSLSAWRPFRNRKGISPNGVLGLGRFQWSSPFQKCLQTANRGGAQRRHARRGGRPVLRLPCLLAGKSTSRGKRIKFYGEQKKKSTPKFASQTQPKKAPHLPPRPRARIAGWRPRRPAAPPRRAPQKLRGKRKEHGGCMWIFPTQTPKKTAIYGWPKSREFGRIFAQIQKNMAIHESKSRARLFFWQGR